MRRFSAYAISFSFLLCVPFVLAAEIPDEFENDNPFNVVGELSRYVIVKLS